LSLTSILAPLLFSLMIRRPPRSPLSLHDALPISQFAGRPRHRGGRACGERPGIADRVVGLLSVVESEHAVSAVLQQRGECVPVEDRKSTRLNSSHVKISYAVFCLKKKKKNNV